MNEIAYLCVATAAGLALGALFFGGLWWTTKKGMASDQPALWFVGSLIARTSVVLVCLYYVSDDDWQRIFAYLVGFIIARLILLRLFSFASFSQETQHGS